MSIASNYQKAVDWIDAQSVEPNTELDLGNGVFINDLAKSLQTNRERLLYCEGYLQLLSFLKVKMIKDKLNQIK
jgi:hypothetical protein